MFDLKLPEKLQAKDVKDHPGLYTVRTGPTKAPIASHEVFEPYCRWEYATMRFNHAFKKFADQVELGVTRVSLIAK